MYSLFLKLVNLYIFLLKDMVRFFRYYRNDFFRSARDYNGKICLFMNTVIMQINI